MEPPEGGQELVARGPADQGVGVVQVPDVDAEEVSESNDRSRGDADPDFGDLVEEVGRGVEGPPSGGAHGRGGHSVQHAHGPVGGGADTVRPIDCPMALGDEHGEGVVGRQSRGAERSACGAGAREQAPGVDGVQKVGEGMASKDVDVVLACGTAHRVAVEVHRVSEEMDPAIAHVRADQDRFGRVRVEVGEATCPFNAGKWQRSPGSHWVSSISRARFSGPAGVSVGGTERQASWPRTSPYMQYFMGDKGHPCPLPAPRRVEDGERPSTPPMCTSGRSLPRSGRCTRWCG